MANEEPKDQPSLDLNQPAAESKTQETKAAPKKEVKTDQKAQPPAKLAPWKNALMKAHTTMLSITDPEKVQVELGYAKQAMLSNTKLQECTPESIMNAVINIARTSLTLNPFLKLCYLVPRDGKCCLDPSYMGLAKILKDHGCVKYMDAVIVFEDEEFDHQPAIGKLHHIPKYAKTEEEQKKRQVKGAYSTAILPDGTRVYMFMAGWEIQKSRKVSKAGGSSFSPWNTWEEEMIKKTPLKRHFKYLISGTPIENDPKVKAILEIEDENNGLQEMYKANNKKQQGPLSMFEDVDYEPAE